MKYELKKVRGHINPKEFFYQAYADNYMIGIKLTTDFTKDEEVDEWFASCIENHRQPKEQIIKTVIYED
jgi:hypothetical protein